MIKDVETKGYVKLYEPGINDLIEIDDYTLLNNEDRLRDNSRTDVNTFLRQKLDVVHTFLHQKYIKPTYPNSECTYWNIWDGVDRDNEGWHTDFMEGYDIFFLYYFDTTKEETGGHISFKWENGEVQFQPVKGDLFLVSNKRGFWHKAGATDITRRVASFNFKTNAT